MCSNYLTTYAAIISRDETAKDFKAKYIYGSTAYTSKYTLCTLEAEILIAKV